LNFSKDIAMRLLLVVPVLLAGCDDGGGLGRAGSPAWFATTPNDQIIAHFRETCVAYGYSGPQLPACIQQETQAARQGARSKLQRISTPPKAPQTAQTQCRAYGSNLNCVTQY